MASDGRAEFDPSEIARVDFPTAFRGYDQDAVRRYLSRLASAVARAQELGLLGTVDPEQDDGQVEELQLQASTLREQVADLEKQLDDVANELERSAQAQAQDSAMASDQPLDEVELIKLLGTETARILETARSAAADIVQRAQNDAASIKHLTELESRASLDEAESVLTAARSEAENIVAVAEADAAKAKARSQADTARAEDEARANAERVLAQARSTGEGELSNARATAERELSAARSTADRELSSARSEAESELSSAHARSSQLVSEAEALRDDILDDLVTRRRISREQLVVMNAARDRLAVALASARNELDDVASVLQRATPVLDDVDLRDHNLEPVAQSPAVTANGTPAISGAGANGTGSNGTDSNGTGSNGAATTGTGSNGAKPETDRSQRAEVSELVALLDRGRTSSHSSPGSVPGAGSTSAPADATVSAHSTNGRPFGGNGSANGTGTNGKGSGSKDGANGSRVGSAANGSAGPGSKANGHQEPANGSAARSDAHHSGDGEAAERPGSGSGFAIGHGGADRNASAKNESDGSGRADTGRPAKGGAPDRGGSALAGTGSQPAGRHDPAPAPHAGGGAHSIGGTHLGSSGDGLPMEYLTLDQLSAVAVDDRPGYPSASMADATIELPRGGPSARPPTFDPFSRPGPGGLATATGARHDAGSLHHFSNENLMALGDSANQVLGSGSGVLPRSATRGDLPRNVPYGGTLPTAFEGRDIALNRANPGFRRRLKRAVNDDQSEVLERLRAGRGRITSAELPPFEHQLDAYIDALRPVLFDVVTSGTEMLGCLDIPVPSIENLCLQLARHVVECLRTPAEMAIEQNGGADREAILDPIRSIYRDFRNTTLPDLIDDALHEAFALGLYHAISPDDHVLWATDPRLDPDPVCEDNSASRALIKGTNFPSGHPRPLSMPGCRCLVIPAG